MEMINKKKIQTLNGEDNMGTTEKTFYSGGFFNPTE